MGRYFERAYRFRFYPTLNQEQNLSNTFGCTRFVYNHFLEKKSKLWTERKRSLSYKECANQLGQLKREYSWLNDVSSVPLQQSLRHLHKAFENFFKKRAKYPSFKKKDRKQSITYMKNAFVCKGEKIYLAKQDEPLNIVYTRKLPSTPTSITITKEATGEYYISILVKEEIAPLAFVKGAVGIDVGIKSIATDSKKTAHNSLQPLKKNLNKLKKAQKTLCRKKRKSKNYQKQKLNVARCHRKVKNIRHDYLHKLSRQYVNENQVIAVEDLQISNMVKKQKAL